MADLDLLNEFWVRAEKGRIFPAFGPRLRKAEPFALEDEFTEIAAELAFGGGSSHQKTLRYLSSARLPFPSVWIEADFARAFPRQAQGSRWMFGRPSRVGWLLREVESQSFEGFFINRVARVVNDNTKAPLASLYPLEHVVRYEGLFDYHAETDGGSLQDRIDPAITGSVRAMNSEPAYPLMAWHHEPPEKYQQLSLEAINETAKQNPLYGRNLVKFERYFAESLLEQPLMERRRHADSTMIGSLYDQAGELSFLIAALAMINEVPVRYVPYRPSGRMTFKGSTRPFMASRVVHIDVPANRRRIKDIDTRLRNAHAEDQHRRHKVRGYYQHADKLPKRNPERWKWEPHAITGKYCWRTRVESYERGSAALGWVDHTYKVTARRGARAALGLTQKYLDSVSGLATYDDTPGDTTPTLVAPDDPNKERH